MKLTPHFTLEEFTRSERARVLGIDNSLPAELLPAAISTCEMLERIRTTLAASAGKVCPLVLSSGYRCIELNRAIGSRNTSAHVKAMAVDFTAPAFGTPLDVCRLLAPLFMSLGIGQLIYETPAPGRRWVHVSTQKPATAVNRIVTIGPGQVVAGIVDWDAPSRRAA